MCVVHMDGDASRITTNKATPELVASVSRIEWKKHSKPPKPVQSGLHEQDGGA
jgi:hypothetical protein